MLIGDKEFWIFWKKRYVRFNRQKARKLLEELMLIAQMPVDLFGDLGENQYLVSRFVLDLPPHHKFWRQLSHLVNLAFPAKTLEEEGDLQRKIHQFRYVISSQQAQYVRTFYGKPDRTDAQALAAYLAERSPISYYLREPARLHNKVAFSKGVKIYPGDKHLNNIKVLVNAFHSEFIVSSDGDFLNEIDAEKVNDAGIVNGASFNYGHFKRHWDLDVSPIKQHDPPFRKKLVRKYKSPKNSRKIFVGKSAADYELSYYNKKGAHARNGQSRYHLVMAEAKRFKTQIRAIKRNVRKV